MMGKRVLITGAGSGLGREAALRLAAKGHEVIAAVQIWPQASELHLEAQRRGVSLRVEKLDVTSEIDRRHAASIPIDVLLNNAGIGHTGPMAEVPIELVREVFEVNVFGTLALTHAVVQQMVQRGSGHVIFVSSMAGLSTTPFLGPYCASKHALEAIAEAMQAELRPFGVGVSTINPGPYLTGFNDRMCETWRSWYDPQRNFTQPEHLGMLAALSAGFEALPRGLQFDPEEMVELYVRVVESDEGKFRNVLPEPIEQHLRQVQSEAWTRMR